MTTIYVLSTDGKTVGCIQIDPKHADRLHATLAILGYKQISQAEFAVLKAGIVHAMLQRHEGARA